MDAETRKLAERLLWTCSWMSSGGPPDERARQYWIDDHGDELIVHGMQLGWAPFPSIDSYYAQRMLGLYATGRDAPAYGPHADPNQPQFKSSEYFTPVPPFPDDPPVVEPSTLETIAADVQAIRELLERAAQRYL